MKVNVISVFMCSFRVRRGNSQIVYKTVWAENVEHCDFISKVIANALFYTCLAPNECSKYFRGLKHLGCFPGNVLGNELLGNCIIKHYKENCHRIVPFLLTHVMLLVRIMRDCAGICELCDRMRFLINYAGSHHRTISEALYKTFWSLDLRQLQKNT